MSDPKHTDEQYDAPVVPGIPTDWGFGSTGGAKLPRPLADQIRNDGPSPEDEWKIPTGPLDEVVPEPAPEPTHAGGLLRRLTHRG